MQVQEQGEIDKVCYCLVCLSHCFQGLLQVPTASSHTEPIRGLWIGRSSSPPKDTQSTTAWHGSAPQHCCHSVCWASSYALHNRRDSHFFPMCSSTRKSVRRCPSHQGRAQHALLSRLWPEPERAFSTPLQQKLAWVVHLQWQCFPIPCPKCTASPLPSLSWALIHYWWLLAEQNLPGSLLQWSWKSSRQYCTVCI